MASEKLDVTCYNRGETGVTKGLLRKGGANNRADRKSLRLTGQQAAKVIDGCMAAQSHGLWLNRFITISWEPAGLTAQESVAATGEWIALARDWLRQRGYPAAWVWTQERGAKLGAHCHILLHVPPELAPLFSGRPSRWARQVIERRTGAYKAGTVLTRKIAAGRACRGDTPAYEALYMGRLHYLLKCTPAALEMPLGMYGWGHIDWGQECLVYGKRAGVWQHQSVRKIKVAR